MRCFYCSREGLPASEEHIPSKFLGSRLKTRRVCKPCNYRAGVEIDNRFAGYDMVLMPRALANVRSIDHQAKPPSIQLDGVLSETGEPVRVTLSPAGRDVRRLDGGRVHGVFEISYGLDSDLWVQFTAKVALGCAAKLLDEKWLDSRLAGGLQSLLWHARIDNEVWPSGVPGWPSPLEDDHTLRHGLHPHQHLIGFQSLSDGSSAAVAVLFGGELAAHLPLSGLPSQHSDKVWVLDWSVRAVPECEGIDQAIERLLHQRGWTEPQIDELRAP